MLFSGSNGCQLLVKARGDPHHIMTLSFFISDVKRKEVTNGTWCEIFDEICWLQRKQNDACFLDNEMGISNLACLTVLLLSPEDCKCQVLFRALYKRRS